MKIRFSCPACQKVYSVSAELAGKKAKCKQCETLMYVPDAGANEPESPVQIETQQTPVPVQPVPVQPVPVQPVPVQPVPLHPMVVPTEQIQQPGPVSPIPVSPIPVSAPAPVSDANVLSPSEQLVHDVQQGGAPDPRHRLGDTFASNPGEVKVNKLKYLTSYPVWFWVWHGGLAFGLAMIPLQMIVGIVIALFFAFCVWFYWGRIKTHFDSGCANPAQVVSLDPPLIAAHTDLTKGGYPTPVIKVVEQPIDKHAGPPLKVGQLIPTVALYEDRFDEGPHWSTFDPKPVGCVTNDENVVERVRASFDQEDLAEMRHGLAQIPNPPIEGHYRIYKAEDFQRPFSKSPLEIKNIVFAYLQGASYVKVADEIELEARTNAENYVPAQALAQLWAQVELMKGAANGKNGVCLTGFGIYYQFPGGPRGQISYQDIVGALSSNSGIEITLRTGARIYFEDKYFLTRTVQQFDLMLNEISGLQSP